MANLLTDESRLARYDGLLKRKKIYDKIFDICMLVMLIIALTEVIPHFFNGVLRGFFIGELVPFFIFLGVTAFMAFFVYAMSRRDWRFVLPALILSIMMAGGGLFYGFGMLAPIVLLAVLIDCFLWLPLTKEEGFPDFKISFTEEQEKRKVLEKRAEYRTLQAQIREEQPDLNTDADMTDILDADTEKDFMPAHLKNYHERYRNADAVVRPQQPHDDRMDQVNNPDISGEMEEL